MRKITPILAACALFGVAACATTGDPTATYAAQLAQLEADCRDRGGILTAIPGSTGPNPANDYACRIGNASRLN